MGKTTEQLTKQITLYRYSALKKSVQEEVKEYFEKKWEDSLWRYGISWQEEIKDSWEAASKRVYWIFKDLQDTLEKYDHAPLTGLRLKKYIENNVLWRLESPIFYYYDEDYNGKVKAVKNYYSPVRWDSINEKNGYTKRLWINDKGNIIFSWVENEKGEKKYLTFTSRVQKYDKIKDCPLTGVCFDDDFLQPIIDFMEGKADYDSEDFARLSDNYDELNTIINKHFEHELEHIRNNKFNEEFCEYDHWFTADGTECWD